MTHLQKLKTLSLLKWPSSTFPKSYPISSKTPVFSNCIGIPSFYSSIIYNNEKSQAEIPKKYRVRAAAQSALSEYLHGTRSLPFTDAEYMSKNCPIFLDKLLGKLDIEKDIGRSLSKFFRYHPINEFEPFFESLGLKPSEFNPLLPREIFLNDEKVLLENYHVLCNYGMHRCKMGKIYKEATDVFRYDHGVLQSKLRAYEELGLSKTIVIKVMATCPYFLIGGLNADFVKVLEVLKSMGIGDNTVLGQLSEKSSYDWKKMLGFLEFICKMVYKKDEVGELLKKHPGILLDGSGRTAFSTIGMLYKMGCTTEEIVSMFLQLPQVPFGTSMKNLRHGLIFLTEIRLDAEDIGAIMRTHLLMLASIALKKPSSVLTFLTIGKTRLCQMVKKDPLQLKNWILGVKLEPLSSEISSVQISRMEKAKFLLSLGYIENSKEIEKALKMFRGKGVELQDRFNRLVRAGLDPKDVANMVKVAPQVLNQKAHVIEKKIDFLVNELGYPVSELVAWPSFMSYTIGRVKFRFSMYEWLKKEGHVPPLLALSTIISSTDTKFIKKYVSQHQGGLEVWKELKKVHCP